jgi:hypothetical protein
MFSERAGIVSRNVVFTRKFFLDTEETGGWTVTVCTFVFSTADIAVIFMDIGLMRSATFGASNE